MSPPPKTVDHPAPPADPPRSDSRLRLSRVLREIYEEARNGLPANGDTQRANITVGEIIDRADHAGFGFVLAFLALVAIPFVGLSTPFGLAVAFGATQMIVGLHHPWFPQFIRRRRISVDTLDWLGKKLVRWTAWMERLIRPRLRLLTRGPFWALCGVMIMLQGLALALPIPIPGSNWIFIVPIILYAIGLLEDDGLLIVICHVITIAQIALAVIFWEVLEKGLHRIFDWFH